MNLRTLLDHATDGAVQFLHYRRAARITLAEIETRLALLPPDKIDGASVRELLADLAAEVSR